jgi:hypothetical protein
MPPRISLVGLPILATGNRNRFPPCVVAGPVEPRGLMLAVRRHHLTTCERPDGSTDSLSGTRAEQHNIHWCNRANTHLATAALTGSGRISGSGPRAVALRPALRDCHQRRPSGMGRRPSLASPADRSAQPNAVGMPGRCAGRHHRPGPFRGRPPAFPTLIAAGDRKSSQVHEVRRPCHS